MKNPIKERLNREFTQIVYAPAIVRSKMQHIEENYYGLHPKQGEPDRRGAFVDIERELERGGVFEKFGLSDNVGLERMAYEEGKKGAVFELLDQFKVLEPDSKDHPQEGYYLPPQEGKPVILAFHGNAGLASLQFLQTLPLAVEKGYGIYCPEYGSYGDPSSEKPSAKNLEKDGMRAAKFLEDKGVSHKDTIIYGQCLGTCPAIALAAENSKAHASEGVEEYRGLVVDSPMASSKRLIQENVADMVKKGELTLPPLIKPKTVARFISPEHIIRNEEHMRGVTMPVTVMLSPHDDIVPTEHHAAVFAAIPETNEGKKLYSTPFRGHIAATFAETADEIEDIAYHRDSTKYERRAWAIQPLAEEKGNAHIQLVRAFQEYGRYTKDFDEEQKKRITQFAADYIGKNLEDLRNAYDKKGVPTWTNEFYKALDEERKDIRVGKYIENLAELPAPRVTYDEFIDRAFQPKDREDMQERLLIGIEDAIEHKFGDDIEPDFKEYLINKVAEAIVEDKNMFRTVKMIPEMPSLAGVTMKGVLSEAIEKVDLEIQGLEERYAQGVIASPKEEKEKEQEFDKGKGKEKPVQEVIASPKEEKEKEREDNKGKGKKGERSLTKTELRLTDQEQNWQLMEGQVAQSCWKAIKKADLDLGLEDSRALKDELKGAVVKELKAQLEKEGTSGIKVFSDGGKRLKGWREKVDTLAEKELEQRQEKELEKIPPVIPALDLSSLEKYEEPELKQSKKTRAINTQVDASVEKALNKSILQLNAEQRAVIGAELAATVKKELMEQQAGKLASDKRFQVLDDQGKRTERWQENMDNLAQRELNSLQIPSLDISTVKSKDDTELKLATKERDISHQIDTAVGEVIEGAAQGLSKEEKGALAEKVRTAIIEELNDQKLGKIANDPSLQVFDSKSRLVASPKEGIDALAVEKLAELQGKRSIQQGQEEEIFDRKGKGKEERPKGGEETLLRDMPQAQEPKQEKEKEKEREEVRPLTKNAPAPASGLSTILEKLKKQGLEGELVSSTISKPIHRSPAKHAQEGNEKDTFQQQIKKADIPESILKAAAKGLQRAALLESLNEEAEIKAKDDKKHTDKVDKTPPTGNKTGRGY